MKLKVCGMGVNVSEVAELRPDYLGFIFWEPSARFFDKTIPDIAENIPKVGVFVDASISEIQSKVKSYDLQAIQLHGKESPAYCASLKEKLNENQPLVKLIKVFSVNKDFDFDELLPFEELCDFFLFDTKGKLPGGNGYHFDWTMLKNYPSQKSFFLSGGIGPDDFDKISEFLKSPQAKYCHALDINSKFEEQPGIKRIPEIKEFLKKISAIN